MTTQAHLGAHIGAPHLGAHIGAPHLGAHQAPFMDDVPHATENSSREGSCRKEARFQDFKISRFQDFISNGSCRKELFNIELDMSQIGILKCDARHLCV